MPHDITLPTALQSFSLPLDGVLSPMAAAIGTGARTPAAALYVHVPFCSHKCHYCDFYSFVDVRDSQPAFTRRLCRELAAIAPLAGPLRSVFVGGGTPSLLALPHWESLLACLRLLFRFEAGCEFTVECNPESATPELFRLLRGGGVNRASMGAQSFDPAVLAFLERRHDPSSVARAVGAARAAGIERVSVDLIYAVPNQTIETFRGDLARALDLSTDHVSCYNLTYEPATPLTARLRAGEFAVTPEDDEIRMFEVAEEVLSAHGLARYEVSNYARPGSECRHNLAYWRQEQWLAAGPSASGHLWVGKEWGVSGGFRWKNVPRLVDYLGPEFPDPPVLKPSGEADRAGAAPDAGGFSAGVDVEGIEAIHGGTHALAGAQVRAVRERLMTGMRLAGGMDPRPVFAVLDSMGPAALAVTKPSPGSSVGLHSAALRAEAAALAERGLMVVSPELWRISAAGWLLADHVASRLMHALPDPIPARGV